MKKILLTRDKLQETSENHHIITLSHHLIILLLFCFSALQAQTVHYISGNVHIGKSGFMHVRSGDTVNLAGNVTTVRNTSVSQRGMLSFGNTANWRSGNLSFVDGFVRTHNSGAFVFPVGHTQYRPARISASSSGAPTDAAYYSPALYNIAALGDYITEVTDECWIIQGTMPAVITLSWSSDLSSFVSDLSKLSIAGWDAVSNKWKLIESAVESTSSIFGTTSLLTGTGTISTTSAIVPNQYAAYSLANSSDELI